MIPRFSNFQSDVTPIDMLGYKTCQGKAKPVRLGDAHPGKTFKNPRTMKAVFGLGLAKFNELAEGMEDEWLKQLE